MEHNGKFRIPDLVAQYLRYEEILLREQKFFLALLHLQSMKIDWPKDHDPLIENRTYWSSLSEFRKLGCAPRSNDARTFKASIAFWCQTEMFDELYLDQSHRHVVWKISSRGFNTMALMDRYVLLDAQEIASCRSELDLMVCIEIAAKIGMREPRFTLFDGWRNLLENLGEDHFSPLDRRKVDKRLRPVLQRWADNKNVGLVVGFLRDGTKPGFSEVEVRFQHAGSKWSRGKIRKFDLSINSYTITPASGWPTQKPSDRKGLENNEHPF